MYQDISGIENVSSSHSFASRTHSKQAFYEMHCFQNSQLYEQVAFDENEELDGDGYLDVTAEVTGYLDVTA